MIDETEKPMTPAYIPYKTFTRFINWLHGTHIPTQIDKSMMSKMSGGDQSAMISALKFLKLIDSDGKPSQQFIQLIESNEETKSSLLKTVLERAYPFIFEDSIDLKRATTKQIEEAFKGQGASGSTVVKCIAFFLAAAKAADLEISPFVKTPLPVRNASRRAATSKGDTRPFPPIEDEEFVAGTQKLKLPLLGKPDVILIIPGDFSREDWAFLKPILEAYVTRLFGENTP